MFESRCALSMRVFISQLLARRLKVAEEGASVAGNQIGLGKIPPNTHYTNKLGPLRD
jgi:hypothetical protein